MLIYFSRHGQTDWNVSGRIQGQVDQPINDIGRAQAKGNGIKLHNLIGDGEGFDFVASPLGRTRETMELIRGAMGLDPQAYRLDDLLMELNFGDWQGFTESEIGVEHSELLAARAKDKWNFLPPGQHAESYAMLRNRIEQFMSNVRDKSVVVTHGGCIRSLFNIYGGLSEKEASNDSVPQDHILRFEDGKLDWI
ncbi:histidine phosphatase family protein [Bartonella sp. HY329]|uniref:histidine phosphatase family protein n=1 Tax=unclassified Bartonella TaxID=2645622 RepID=UPI0021C98843|nr:MULTISPECIES: histidine phosphatase family protein [unclassified Bartonella]UXM94984.1 histidine phosphatase family protein [Bartonella sp. HY329]UXN09307.1 histidine phosphatase family protein [Bartonella sp. HY328]